MVTFSIYFSFCAMTSFSLSFLFLHRNVWNFLMKHLSNGFIFVYKTILLCYLNHFTLLPSPHDKKKKMNPWICRLIYRHTARQVIVHWFWFQSIPCRGKSTIILYLYKWPKSHHLLSNALRAQYFHSAIWFSRDKVKDIPTKMWTSVFTLDEILTNQKIGNLAVKISK